MHDSMSFAFLSPSLIASLNKKDALRRLFRRLLQLEIASFSDFKFIKEMVLIFIFF